MFALDAMADLLSSKVGASMNNEGQHKYLVAIEAIEKFQRAMKLDPKQQLAKDNMAIVCNNYGMEQINLSVKISSHPSRLNPDAWIRLRNSSGISAPSGAGKKNFGRIVRF